MHIRDIYDNKTDKDDLHAGWGLSFLIGECILFDTGESGDALITNMRTLGVDIEKIKAVVISHDHWDHQGGLRDLLKMRKGLLIYGCSDMRNEWESEIIRSGNRFEVAQSMMKISEGIFLTGGIMGKYKEKDLLEQALVTKSEKGISMLTGCAHPGILKMAERVKENFKKEHFYAVIGGMHMRHESTPVIKITADVLKREMGIEKVGPTHCSGTEARKVFSQKYGGSFLDFKVGQVADI